MSKRPAPNLSVIGDAPTRPGLPPPESLGPIGRSLWSDVTAAYEFADRASYETLFQACSAADRAEKCRKLIDEQGEVVKARGGILRDHPLLKHEIAARSFTVRTLARLGLDLEPVRSGPGRPPGGA